MKVNQPSALMSRFFQREYCDDFEGNALNADLWDFVVTPNLSSSPSNARQVSGSDNAQAVLFGTGGFVVAANKPVDMYARVKSSNAAGTNDFNLFVGLAITFGSSGSEYSGLLQDDGAGLKVAGGSDLFFGIYKLDAETNLRTVSSLGITSRLSNLSSQAAVINGGYTTYKVSLYPKSITEVEVTFGVDPTGGTDTRQLLDGSVTQVPTPIKHIVDLTVYAGAGSIITPVVYGKQGSASAMTLDTDFIAAVQQR